MPYEEGLEVGYRHFDAAQIEPQFPFGFGLTYTQFVLSDVALTQDSGDAVAQVTVTVTNTGEREGAEVVQLYIHDVESSVFRPEKELKGFQKVHLAAGASRTITLTIQPQDLQFFDTKENVWRAEPGQFEALVGTSSRDIVARLPFAID